MTQNYTMECILEQTFSFKVLLIKKDHNKYIQVLSTGSTRPLTKKKMVRLGKRQKVVL